MSEYYNTFPNRTVCNVLDEMRKCYETRNFAALLGLIEEAQSMANRMEAGLYDKNDNNHARSVMKVLREKIKRLKVEKEDLETKKCKS